MYKLIAALQDKGVNVRKRVVKMLSRLYAVVPEDSMRINICNKLLWRIKDEDSTVRVCQTSLRR